MVKNYRNVTPKKWSRSLTGGGRLLEVPTVRLRLGIVVVLDTWSHMKVRLFFNRDRPSKEIFE